MRAGRLAAVIAVAVSSISASSIPAKATPIPFDIIFGTQGTGTFVYDDDDGGTDNGFTSFILDFSGVDSSLGNL